ncbi:hypothetical protein [Halopseudomonas yangmingensis]|uniref:Uncharacterized protein n=1 Tax=Halopseudomonas yangmingensis TaxID=1720063 RepID=A0A1I4ULF7_9GAMM|nr:hypothetical protein [Halopseudomonas yangmingensis]SFM89812.1 hypothetical protein SAMN05216217_1267 [Halopseudomonas yangmingensis]
MRIKMRGSAAVEYALGLVFFVAVVLAPVFSGKNAVELLIDAIKLEHSAYMHASSMSL